MTQIIAIKLSASGGTITLLKLAKMHYYKQRHPLLTHAYIHIAKPTKIHTHTTEWRMHLKHREMWIHLQPALNFF